jgi:hypothetical protein
VQIRIHFILFCEFLHCGDKKSLEIYFGKRFPIKQGCKTTKNSTQIKSDYTEGKGPIGRV